MKLRFHLLSMLVVHVGCQGSEQPSDVGEEPRIAAASPDALSGSYYRGDGLGYNIDLDLHADGSYDAEWRGCLGIYGTASGCWSSDGEHIVLNPRIETDKMQGYLRQLDVVRRADHPILLSSNDREVYDKHGVSRYSCFQRTEAVK